MCTWLLNCFNKRVDHVFLLLVTMVDNEQMLRGYFCVTSKKSQHPGARTQRALGQKVRNSVGFFRPEGGTSPKVPQPPRVCNRALDKGHVYQLAPGKGEEPQENCKAAQRWTWFSQTWRSLWKRGQEQRGHCGGRSDHSIAFYNYVDIADNRLNLPRAIVSLQLLRKMFNELATTPFSGLMQIWVRSTRTEIDLPCFYRTVWKDSSLPTQTWAREVMQTAMFVTWLIFSSFKGTYRDTKAMTMLSKTNAWLTMLAHVCTALVEFLQLRLMDLIA